jgi:hypothetical protein
VIGKSTVTGSEFAAINSDHFFSDQAQFIAYHTELMKSLLYLIFVVFSKIRYGFKIGF